MFAWWIQVSTLAWFGSRQFRWPNHQRLSKLQSAAWYLPKLDWFAVALQHVKASFAVLAFDTLTQTQTSQSYQETKTTLQSRLGQQWPLLAWSAPPWTSWKVSQHCSVEWCSQLIPYVVVPEKDAGSCFCWWPWRKWDPQPDLVEEKMSAAAEPELQIEHLCPSREWAPPFHWPDLVLNSVSQVSLLEGTKHMAHATCNATAKKQTITSKPAIGLSCGKASVPLSYRAMSLSTRNRAHWALRKTIADHAAQPDDGKTRTRMPSETNKV